MKTASAEINMLYSSLERAMQACSVGDMATAGAMMDSASVHAKQASDAMYAISRAEAERCRANKPLGQPFGQHLADCAACKASGRRCDFDPERGSCPVLS